MEFGFTIAAYVVAAVLFILSLGGLSGQESAKRAVWYGIVGMAIAVVATLLGPGSGLAGASIVLILLGAGVGYQLATKVQMTQMPELVAGMHALVGLAAVLVGFNAHFEMVNVLAMDEAAKKALEAAAKENEFFAEVWQSQKDFADTVVPFWSGAQTSNANLGRAHAATLK